MTMDLALAIQGAVLAGAAEDARAFALAIEPILAAVADAALIVVGGERVLAYGDRQQPLLRVDYDGGLSIDVHYSPEQLPSTVDAVLDLVGLGWDLHRARTRLAPDRRLEDTHRLRNATNNAVLNLLILQRLLESSPEQTGPIGHRARLAISGLQQIAAILDAADGASH
jgi:hypothetical protein